MKSRYLAIVAMAVLLAGCGTDHPSAKPKGGPPTATASYASFNDYQLAFAKCMRDHGQKYEDPKGDSIAIQRSGDEAGAEAAARACRDQLGNPPPPSDGKVQSAQERQDKLLEQAQCLRQHGVNVADPKSGEPINVPDNAPQDALTACGARAGMTGVTHQ
jgi:hypothetical protein